MNDPGLDAPIGDNADEVERKEGSDEDPDGTNADQAFLQPSRWWFASTAFPLLAGTFGPMASAFNVCALAGKWRVVVDVAAGQSEDDGMLIHDPSWLLGINAISLVLALIANLALLLNMAQRLSFTIAQPITIIGWYLSGSLLIGLLVAAVRAPSFQLPAAQDPHFTQAFYYCIMAAALYLIIATLMLVTVYGAYAGHYPKEFRLTMSQRTLMVQTIAYLVYLLAGAAVFAHVENWLFLDGVYWANTTLLTVGTGDYSPSSHTGQALLFPFAIGGIVFLGLVIGSIRSLILERGKKKLSARMVEKKREQVVGRLLKNNGTHVKVSRLRAARHVRASVDGGDGDAEAERRRAEFEVMRLVQDHAASRRKWMALCVSLTAWFFLWFVGAVVFWRAEVKAQGLTYFESLYFSYVSLLTIGYGDYSPVANSSKAFFVFWSLLAVPTLTILISNMGDTVVKGVRDVSLWAAEITVLPGETSMRQRLLQSFRQTPLPKLRAGDPDGPDKAPEANGEAPGGPRAPRQDGDAEGGRAAGETTKSRRGLDKAADRLGEAYEAEQLDEMERARKSGDRFEEDVHLHHYFLARQIRTVMRDVGLSPPRRYRYEEWSWFLRLLGEDERSGEFHRSPEVRALKEDLEAKGGDQIGGGGGGGEGGQTSRKQWSWLGARSPLLGEADEAEWVLEQLTGKLEELLRVARDRRRGEDGGREREALAREERRMLVEEGGGKR